MSTLKYYNGTNWKEVNGHIVGDTLPIGSIIPFGGETAPAGWLLCWGQELSRASYPELYSAIGDAFGGDDGDLTFNLPDLRGRTIVGKNFADTDFNNIGKTGGEKKHTLTTNEMPDHNHMGEIYSKNYNDNKSLSGNRAYARSFADVVGGWNYTVNGETGGQIVDTIETGNSGGGQAHNILQPYQVTNYIIKYKNAVGLVGNVLNSSSNSHTDSYSCDYINGTTLYSNATGTAGDITLSESVANYSTIKLYYYYNHWSGKIYGSKEVSAINNSYTCLGAELQFYDLGYMYWCWSRRKLNGTTISDEAHGQGSNKSGETNNTSNDIYVYKVIGYK